MLLRKKRIVDNITTRTNMLTNIDEALGQIILLWPSLTPEQEQKLREAAELRHMKKHSLIYSVLDEPQDMMFLINGKVKIFKDGISGGHEQIVRIFKPQDFFGYRAFFAGENYKTSAMTIEDSTILFLQLKEMEGLMMQCPSVSMYFLRKLAGELGKSDELTVNLTQKHIRGRLAEALLSLKDTYGVEDDGQTLSICLSREEMANLSNMTTSNAIRTLSAFAQEGLLVLDGRRIKIVNEEELRHISHLG